MLTCFIVTFIDKDVRINTNNDISQNVLKDFSGIKMRISELQKNLDDQGREETQYRSDTKIQLSSFDAGKNLSRTISITFCLRIPVYYDYGILYHYIYDS